MKMDKNRSVTAKFWTCLVPSVKGKGLAGAKRAIAGAHCSVGNVSKAFSQQVKSGHVLSQTPRPGAKRAIGTRVKLVVSKGRRPNR